jgi:hypothetical protein
MTDFKPTSSYPFVYDSKVLNSPFHTGTSGETRVFESVKQGGKRGHSKRSKKKKSSPRVSKRRQKSNKRNNRKTSHKK